MEKGKDEDKCQEVKPSMDDVLYCQVTHQPPSKSLDGKSQEKNDYPSAESKTVPLKDSNVQDSAVPANETEKVFIDLEGNPAEMKAVPLKDSNVQDSAVPANEPEKVFVDLAGNPVSKSNKGRADPDMAFREELASGNKADDSSSGEAKTSSSSDAPKPESAQHKTSSTQPKLASANADDESLGDSKTSSAEPKLASAKTPEEAETPSLQSKLVSDKKDPPTVPTLETPKEESSAQKPESRDDSKPSPSQATIKRSGSKQLTKSEKSHSKRVLKRKSSSSSKESKGKQSKSAARKEPEGNNEKSARTISSKVLPQDKPIIDPVSYHRKFCIRRKKKKLQSMKQCMSKMQTDMMFPPSDYNMAGMKMPYDNMNQMPNDMKPPPDRLGPMAMGNDMMDGSTMFDRLPSKDVVGGMMDRMMSRLNSSGGIGMGLGMDMMNPSGGMGMMGDPMGMNDRMMGMGGKMGMSDRMLAMSMGTAFSPNEMQQMSPSARRMALGFSMGMQSGMGNFNPMNMMRGESGGRLSMMSSGGSDKTPGNLQELREMMGKDMGMDRMGAGMFNRTGSANGADMDSSDGFSAAMFNRMGSKGSAASVNKEGPGNMANQLLNSLGSKGSAASNNAKTDGSDAAKNVDRRGSSDTAKGSGGSPSIGESYMAGPLLPTPAEFKPSFKKSYKDISFSPLDNLDRGLMQRMMALQESNPNGNSMGGTGALPSMPGMPLMPNDRNKRKASDFAYSPRSPNPKKSFLERHRMMDLEMKGHLDEAMANFSKFQKKYSGGSGGNSSSMLGLKETASVPTGAPQNITAKKKSEESNIHKKSKKATKKKKPKDDQPEMRDKDKDSADPRKPKRPFSAYNIFFQLEREAILARANQGRDPLKDKIEKEYNQKVKDGEVPDEDGPLGPLPPHNPAIHEPFDDAMPDRYRNLRLEKMWFRAGAKAKRRHRKSKGASVPFLELTKMISRRWASVDEYDPEIKKYCAELGKKELDMYRIEMDEYKIELAKDHLNTQLNGSEANSDESDHEPEHEIVEVMMPKRKRPKQNKPNSLDTELGSKTPNAFREAMFDPRFSSRLSDISKMSSFFPQGTPKDSYANLSMGPSAGRGSSLPPPPIFSEENGPAGSDIKRRMAAMAEAERRFGGASMGGLRGAEGRGDEVGDRAAFLADARRRMQMDMMSMGQGGPNHDFPRGAMNNILPGGDILDRPTQFSNMHNNMMNQDMFSSAGRGGNNNNMMNSMMMHNHIMGRLNPPSGMPQNEQDFDAEVEKFLTTLGKEMKNGRKQMNSAAGDNNGPYTGDGMMNRMMMMDRMMANRLGGAAGGDGMNLLQFSNFRSQMMGNNDNPQLPEFEDSGSGPNSRSASSNSRRPK